MCLILSLKKLKYEEEQRLGLFLSLVFVYQLVSSPQAAQQMEEWKSKSFLVFHPHFLKKDLKGASDDG